MKGPYQGIYGSRQQEAALQVICKVIGANHASVFCSRLSKVLGLWGYLPTTWGGTNPPLAVLTHLPWLLVISRTGLPPDAPPGILHTFGGGRLGALPLPSP